MIVSKFYQLFEDVEYISLIKTTLFRWANEMWWQFAAFQVLNRDDILAEIVAYGRAVLFLYCMDLK